MVFSSYLLALRFTINLLLFNTVIQEQIHLFSEFCALATYLIIKNIVQNTRQYIIELFPTMIKRSIIVILETC